MVRLLHISDIHLGSGLSHGRINPATGLHTRFEDFLYCLSQAIDRGLAEGVDLALFGGDAFPNATPEPTHQEEFARQFKRLTDAGIPTVLLVGNHDLHGRGVGGASLNIYAALQVPGFVVGSRLQIHPIATRSGPVQVLSLPWVNRSTLLTREEMRGKSLEQVDLALVERMKLALEAQVRRLDPAVPTVLLGHLMVENAVFGAERHLAVGRSFSIPLAMLARSEFDYVALGHVHRHQVLCEDPPIIYPGSIERVDFGEEKESKGFILAEVERGRCRYEFVSVPARSFKTIQANLADSDDPQGDLAAILRKHKIEGAIVRVLYRLHPHQIERIDSAGLRQMLEGTFSYQLQPELISQLSQPRVPGLGESCALDPIDALRQYLESRPELADLRLALVEAAEALIKGDSPGLPDTDECESDAEVLEVTTTAALDLLARAEGLPAGGTNGQLGLFHA
ncbi:metallophosphoesterase family protein [Gloeobacter morelensis]|uniref:Nuclease SbcCD subunit D n=1 Tax=Gloeobacter morelensis MG652769 TaxID=2781736 RepID=A0ABY3PPZ9_9CYAN|nr:exonuclease SbcCD subunit D [Gloeobacter morelensis]UFP95721.1 exonuclease SbcCD subunit D [Gloeobacter morelensis MG652769]